MIAKKVSTHSRPKAAAQVFRLLTLYRRVSTHSRPKAAASYWQDIDFKIIVSTHSRPKAAALLTLCDGDWCVCFNTQPPEGGCQTNTGFIAIRRPFQHTAARRRLLISVMSASAHFKFQHTAARRRLHSGLVRLWGVDNVSTHSRPKAAAPYIKR